ncbi:MAG: hypothetical protein ABIA74_03500 [bacterium]
MKKRIFISIILLNSLFLQSNAQGWFWGEQETKTQKSQKIQPLRTEENQNIQEISAEVKEAVTSGLQKINDDLKNEYQQILLTTIEKITEQIEVQSQEICNRTGTKTDIEYLITFEISKSLNESTKKYKNEIATPKYLTWLTDLIVSKIKEFSASKTEETLRPLDKLAAQGGRDQEESLINFTEIKDKISDIISQKFAQLISKTGRIINQEEENELEQITKEIINTLDNILTEVGIILADLVKKITYKFVDNKLYDLRGSSVYRGTVANFAGNMASNKITEYSNLIIKSIRENPEKIQNAIEPHIQNIKKRIEVERKVQEQLAKKIRKKRPEISKKIT